MESERLEKAPERTVSPAGADLTLPAAPAAAKPVTRRPSVPAQFLNRELGILAFNRRVLAQAADDTVPLLERLRFITIVSSNLDEFFEIRVAGLKEQIKLGLPEPGPDGGAPAEVFDAVSREAHALVAEQYQLLNQTVLPALAGQSIVFPKREEWSAAQRQWIRDYFFRELLPVLTPIGLDPAHPFPRVFNKSLNFALELEGRDAFGRSSGAAIVQAPRALPRRHPPAAGDRRRGRVRVRVPVLDPARAHGRAVRGHERAGLLPVPRHAQLGPVRRGGGDQEPAHRAAGRALPPALRRRGAARSRRQLLAAHGGIPAAAVRPARRRPLPRRRTGEPVPPARGARPGRRART